MRSLSSATLATLTILGAPLSLPAQPQPTTVLFGTKLVSHGYWLFAPVLSPDGRWLAAFSMSASESSILIMPATGGSFRQLVPASDRPTQIAWFASGDRVAYMSDRIGGIVVSDFDGSTGSLRGTPRRVTLERAGQFAIAPDGQSIAYELGRGSDRVLKVVPVTGGTARELLRQPANALGNVRFAKDGKTIFFMVRSPRERESVYRVSIGGGKPELVWKPTTLDGFTLVDPIAGRIVRSTKQTIAFMTLQGDTILVMPSGGAMSAFAHGALSADGRSMFVAPSDVGTIMRAIPLAGGKPVDLSTNKEYFWPIGWSSDSRTAYFLDDAGRTVHQASLDGSSRRTVAFDPQPRPANLDGLRVSGVSGDGRYLYVFEPTGKAAIRRAYLYDTQTRALRTITDSLAIAVNGRGGRYLPFHHESGEFLFLQRTGGAVGRLGELPREIRAVKPGGTSRLVRRVPPAADSADGFIVDGDRVFWKVIRNDTTSLFASLGSAPAAKVWATTGRGVEFLLSNDGNRMAVAMEQPAANGQERWRFQFLRIDANGKVTSDGASATFGSYWDAYWAPGDQVLVALEYPAEDLDTRLIRIPANGAAVSYIVKPGTTTFWAHYLSPDGKYSLLPAESQHGASIWRIDLDAAERNWKQRRSAK